MELNYQQRVQKIWGTEINWVETTQKVFEQSYKNSKKEDYEPLVPSQPPICWKCCKVGHMKKNCVKILYCINCGRNNQTASRCRQPFREACSYCKKMDHSEEQCPSKRLENFRRDNSKLQPLPRSRTPTLVSGYQPEHQTREFQVRHGEQPRYNQYWRHRQPKATKFSPQQVPMETTSS